MKKALFGALLFVAACAAWDYAAALQTCIDSHIGDPQGREQCLCDVSKDAGRSCDYLDGGAQ